MKRSIQRAKKGDGFDVRLPAEERELLASLPGQLVELLAEPDLEDPAVARLFPDAYSAADTDLADEYRRLMAEDLRDRLVSALDALSSSAHAERVTADELYGWMTALTQLRLVLGTRLGVTEDAALPDDDPAYNVYGYLSWLQEQVVEALASTL